jgi:hypothetical protein
VTELNAGNGFQLEGCGEGKVDGHEFAFGVSDYLFGGKTRAKIQRH